MTTVRHKSTVRVFTQRKLPPGGHPLNLNKRFKIRSREILLFGFHIYLLFGCERPSSIFFSIYGGFCKDPWQFWRAGSGIPLSALVMASILTKNPSSRSAGGIFSTQAREPLLFLESLI